MAHFSNNEIKDLDAIMVPLPELRQAIAQEMAAGKLELPLTDLLLLIRLIYRQNKD